MKKTIESIKGYENLSDCEKETLAEVYQAILSGDVYTTVINVSKSGLSRDVKFLKVSNQGIENITPYIAWLADYAEAGNYEFSKYELGGLRIRGVGLDVVLHTLRSCLSSEDARSWKQHYNRL